MSAEHEMAIVTDSTCDLPNPEGITVVPAIITLDGQDYLDGQEITPAEVLKLVENPKIKATTAAPGPEIIKEVFGQYNGEILAVSLAKEQSRFFESFAQAGRDLDPDKKRISIFDSGVTSLALGHMVDVAAGLRRLGISKDKILEKLASLKSRAKLLIAFDVLEYARRSGRVSNLTAFMGSLIQIKPIVGMEKGDFIQIETPRTRKKQLEHLVESVKAMAPLEWLGVVYAGVADEAQEIALKLHDLVNEKIMVTHIGTALSIHAGPGVVGVCAFTKE